MYLGNSKAGINKGDLEAIFREGSRAVPGLVAATANAVGARTVNNDPLATALGDLHTLVCRLQI